MKKLFTLLAAVLIAGSAFGQEKWVNLVPNGDMEAEMPAYETYEGMAADAWNPFWVHEFPKGEVGEAQYQGTATIVEGLGRNSSKCAKVVARSDEQAIAAENRTEANGNLASWDCQFFIYATEPMLEGKEVRLTMWVKADHDGKMETQAHYGPGNYNHYSLFGDVTVTTTWTKYQSTITVSADQSKQSDDKYFQTVAFNLSTDVAGNVFYFDDIKLEVRDPKEGPDPTDGNWVNFLRHGTLSADKFGNYTTFTGRDYVTGKDLQALVVDDEIDGQPALKVSAPDLVEIDDLDSEGNQQLDDDGNVKTKKVYLRWNEDKQANDTIASDDWLAQFFVTVGHKFKKGEKYKLVYWVRADKDATADTQAHTMPGGYQHWACVGSPAFTPEWTQIIAEGTMPNEVDNKNCQTVAFNLYKLKEANNYYFRFEEFSFMDTNVKDEELILAQSNLTLPVDNSEEGLSTPVDFAEMLTTLEATDFGFMDNYADGDGLKLWVQLPPEEEGDDPIEKFSGALKWTDGGFLNSEGFLVDTEEGINIYVDEESVNGTTASIVTWNAGQPIVAGTAIPTKLCFAKDGWYYVYNVTLIDNEAYLSIKDIQETKKFDGVVYDLMGRKVSKPAKGLYIVNGKKYILK